MEAQRRLGLTLAFVMVIVMLEMVVLVREERDELQQAAASSSPFLCPEAREPCLNWALNCGVRSRWQLSMMLRMTIIMVMIVMRLTKMMKS